MGAVVESAQRAEVRTDSWRLTERRGRETECDEEAEVEVEDRMQPMIYAG